MNDILLITAIITAVAGVANILLTLSKNITYFRYDFIQLSSIKIEHNTVQLDILDHFNAKT